MSSPRSPRRSDAEIDAAVLERPAARLSGRRAVLTVSAAALALALLIWGLPALTGSPWSEVLATAGGAPAWCTAALVVLPVLILLVDASGLRAAIPGLPRCTTVRADALATAVGLGVPGGGTIALAVLYGALRPSGLPRRDLVRGAVLASVIDSSAAMLLPAVGVAAYALSGSTALRPGAFTTLLVLAALSLLLLVVLLGIALGPGFARLAGSAAGIVGDLPWGPDPEAARAIAAAVVVERDAARDVLRARAARILLPPVIVRGLQAAILLVALQGTGLHLSVSTVLAVFALNRVLAMIPLTPGGAGITEAGTAGALLALGQASAAAAAAAVLASVGTLIVPLALGALALLLPGPGRRAA